MFDASMCSWLGTSRAFGIWHGLLAPANTGAMRAFGMGTYVLVAGHMAAIVADARDSAWAHISSRQATRASMCMRAFMAGHDTYSRAFGVWHGLPCPPTRGHEGVRHVHVALSRGIRLATFGMGT